MYALNAPPARIIFLNGTSSAGKSMIASALKPLLPKSFCYFASDQLAEGGFRAADVSASARAAFFDGFHQAIGAFAHAGNDMIVEHIVEEQSWAHDLCTILAPYDTFWVGVHCDLATLEEREVARGNRHPGEAQFHLKTHQFLSYDLEVDGTQSAQQLAQGIKTHWEKRTT